MLVNRQTAGPVQSLFAGIFGASPPIADANDQVTAAMKISA
jgi:hypothetical protein